MTFARIETDGTVTHPYRVPDILKTDTDHYDLRSMDPKLLAVHGIFEVIETVKPADDAATVAERSVELVKGKPTTVWTERDVTTAEVFNAEQQAAPDTTAVLIARLIAADIPALWRQPQGAHDAYLPGAIVLDDKGDRWRNDLGTANVWPVTNLHAKWTNLDFVKPVGPQPWVQPTGAHDAYKLNEQVTHKGQTWTNTGSDANAWEPGVFGWVAA